MKYLKHFFSHPIRTCSHVSRSRAAANALSLADPAHCYSFYCYVHVILERNKFDLI